MNTSPAESTRGPNCWQCRFFAVSWDPRLPYACQRMGFKSAALPALEVLRTDGQPCHGFATKGAATTATTPAPSPRTAAAPAPAPSARIAPPPSRGWSA